MYNKNLANAKKVTIGQINLTNHSKPLLINNDPLSTKHLKDKNKLLHGIDSTFTLSEVDRQALLFDATTNGKDSFVFKNNQIFISDGSTVNEVIHKGNLQRSTQSGSNSESEGIIIIKPDTPLVSGSQLQIKQSPFPLCVVGTDGRIESRNIFDPDLNELVMGNVKDGHSGKAYRQGFVRTGSATHNNQFLRKDGQWAIVSESFSGTVAENFLSLNDTPNSYDGNIGKLLQTSATSGGSLVFVEPNTLIDARIVTKLTDGSISDLVKFGGNLQCLAVQTVSDRNLKKNIKDLKKQKMIRAVRQLQTKEFRYKKDLTNTTHYGFIAQEVEKISGLENLVSTDKNGYKSVNYIEVVPLLVAAIQDLYSELAFLKGSSRAKSGDYI